MDKIRTIDRNYSIRHLTVDELSELAAFVVTENYKRHKTANENANYRKEIDCVYSEELNHFNRSLFFVARNPTGKIIGSIRVMRWNKKGRLPTETLFGIDVQDKILREVPFMPVWHIGRFAVSAEAGTYGIALFKKLMVYAINPICRYEQGIMFAECDIKLLGTMNRLGIRTTTLGKEMVYMGSETLPICATRDGLIGFFIANRLLAYDGETNRCKTGESKQEYILFKQ